MPFWTSSGSEIFLHRSNPEAAQRALSAIWSAVERLQEFPAMGMQTVDADIRQIVIRFGSSGYIVGTRWFRAAAIY
jgi:toxin ParE1/3/4